ncbi:MAG TPA: hypothetical protein VJN18_22385 [Polyangiaceae bacterium]|nr:hypothetical protein [Polyangiaceae bacterium]
MRVSASLVTVLVCLRASRCLAEVAGYELEYAADAACPTRAQFAGLVDYYLEGEAPGSDAQAHVSLRGSSAGVEGIFTLQRADGSSYTRKLEAATCQEVTPALAFVLAYALAGRHSEPPSRSDPVLPEPATTQREVAAPPRLAAPEPDRESAPRAGSDWRFGGGVAFGVRSGLGPSWTPIEVARVAVRRERKDDSLVLAVVASVLRDQTTKSEHRGTTSFAWLAGRLDFCPLRLELTTELGLLPCAGTHVGRLLATGEPATASGARGRKVSKLWADATLTARLELRLWRMLALETQAELVFPLTPYRFAFDNPDTTVYRVPSVAAAAFVGLGVHFR